MRRSASLALLALIACGGNDSEPPGASAATEPERKTWPLGRMVDEANIESLPESSRPDGMPAPEAVPIAGPYKQISVNDELVEYEAPIPARPRNWSRPDRPTWRSPTSPT